MPDWLGEFEIAKRLGVPVAELPNQPARLLYRAATLIQAEHEYEKFQQAEKQTT